MEFPVNAAVVSSFEASPRYTTFDDPVPGDGEVLVKVSAAALHPIVKALAAGTHYGNTGVLPFVPGVDGVGLLDDGRRIYFGASRPPFGTFSERALTSRTMHIELPAGLDDATAAGIANPGMSSWVALTFRAKFVAGESVLILGATGVAGQLAVQIAKRLGARRVIAAGRNPRALEELQTLGADSVVSLEQNRDALTSGLRREWSEGVDVVLDYLWGGPVETVLAAISQQGLKGGGGRIRFVQIGSSAGPTISLQAATLRCTAIEILGSGFGSASLSEIFQAVREFFKMAAGQPFHLKTKTAPLSDVEKLWNTPERGVRLVFLP
jgi:NADPH2:quinone reductase